MRLADWIVIGAWAMAVAGWLSHWNAYTNLALTMGAMVLTITLLVGRREEG